jgi:lambda family phage tail tape measure protein
MSNSAGSLASLFSLDASNFIVNMQNAGKVTQTEADRMQRTLKQVNAQLTDLSKMSKDAANLGSGVRSVGEEAQKTAGHTSGLTREILVLMHEASQDNWKRLGGSLLVFGEYMTTMSLATVAARVGFIGMLGVAGLLAIEVGKGAIEQDKFNKSLMLTGNFAGITADRLNEMARAAALATNGTVGASRQTLEELVSSGQFGPKQLGPATDAVLLLQRVTGQTTEEIVKDFAKMGEGVAKWAAEHNRVYHDLSAAQYEYIHQLERQGKVEEAEGVALEALRSHLTGVNQNLGSMARAWLEVKQKGSEFFDWVASIGRSSTLDETITTATADLDRLRKAAQNNAILKPGEFWRAFTGQQSLEDQVKAQQALVDHLQQTKRNAAAVAQAASDTGRTQQEGIKARERLDSMLEQAKGAMSLQEALKHLEAEFEHAAKAGAPLTEAQKQLLIEEEKRRHTSRQERAGDNFLLNLQRQVEATEKGHDAMLFLEAAQKGVAAAAAPWIARLREVELRAERIKRIIADTAEAEAQASKVSELITAGNDLSKSYIEQAQAIGLNAEELERLNMQRKLEADLQRSMVGADADTVAKLYAQDAINRANASARLQEMQTKRRAYEADPANGAKKAFDDYIRNAQDQAKYTENLVTGSLQHAEDAFVQFAKTGKLSLTDLFSFMAEEYLRNLFRMEAAQIAQNGLGSVVGNISSVWGSVGSFFGFGHATGLNYVPYDGYPAILHEGEKVMTKQEASMSRGGGASVIHVGQGQVINVGQGVSMSQVYAVVAGANKQSESRIRRLQREGVFG